MITTLVYMEPCVRKFDQIFLMIFLDQFLQTYIYIARVWWILIVPENPLLAGKSDWQVKRYDIVPIKSWIGFNYIYLDL